MPDTRYRQGDHSPINVWLIRAGSEDRQVAMARTDWDADQLVRLANAGLALAEADPRAVYPVAGTDRTTSLCALCGAIEGAGDLHLAECPWRMAREALGLPAGWPVAADPQPGAVDDEPTDHQAVIDVRWQPSASIGESEAVVRYMEGAAAGMKDTLNGWDLTGLVVAVHIDPPDVPARLPTPEAVAE